MIKEKVLGEDHPDVAITLNNLAVFYKSTQQFVKAEELFKRALMSLEKAFGASHPAPSNLSRQLCRVASRVKRHLEAKVRGDPCKSHS
jgi:hypothetical protein